MGTDTIILAVGKWKRHCLFLLARAKSAEASSPCFAASGQNCHSWAKSCLHLATAAALQAHCDGQEDRDQWRSPALSERHHCASHCVWGFSTPFSSSLSCFQRQTLRKAVQQAWIFLRIFLRKYYFWIFQSNPSMTKPKDFLAPLRTADFSE